MMNTEEQSFLESRRIRCENRAINTRKYVDNDRKDMLDTFWVRLKDRIKEWNHELDRIATREVSSLDGSVTETKRLPLQDENEKRQVQLELLKLSKYLKTLRKHCLTTTTSSSSSPSVDPGNVEGFAQRQTSSLLTESDVMAIIVPDDMPLTDVRLLHREFMMCQAKLDKIYNEILPKGKFVFKRYREAIEKQQQEQKTQNLQNNAVEIVGKNEGATTDATNKETLAHAEAESRQREEEDKERGILRGYRNKCVVVQSDGRIETKSISSEFDDVTNIEESDVNCSTGQSGIQVQSKSTDMMFASSSLILKDLQNCTIELCGSNYMSIHIQSAFQSIIYVYNPIQGAVHITDCQHCTLYILSTAHQLRIHESHDFKFYICVGILSGIILEECKRIVFLTGKPTESTSSGIASSTKQQQQQKQPEQRLLDIKDFEWLRSGVPSPNYSIVTVGMEEVLINDDIIQSYRRRNSISTKESSVQSSNIPSLRHPSSTATTANINLAIVETETRSDSSLAPFYAGATSSSVGGVGSMNLPVDHNLMDKREENNDDDEL